MDSASSDTPAFNPPRPPTLPPSPPAAPPVPAPPPASTPPAAQPGRAALYAAVLGAMLLALAAAAHAGGAYLTTLSDLDAGAFLQVVAAGLSALATMLLTRPSPDAPPSAPVARRDALFGIIMLSAGALLYVTALMMHVAEASIGWSGLSLDGPILQALAIPLACRGAWLLAQSPTPQPPRGAAAAASWGALALLFLWALVFGMTLAAVDAAPRCVELALAVAAVWTVWLGHLLARLALRIGRESLADQCADLAWALPCALLALELYQFQWIDVAAGFQTYFFISYPLLGALLGLLAWVLVTLTKLSFALWRAARPPAPSPAPNVPAP